MKRIKSLPRTDLKSSKSKKLRTYLPENTRTVLGDVRPNPYNVDNITQAAQELVGEEVERFPVTDYYVEFAPENLEQFTRLDESGMLLFDYPLDREVIVQGDHYVPLEEYADGYPKFYTSVPANYSFPTDISYIILDEMYFPEYIPADLEFQALKRVGANPNEELRGGIHCCDNPCSEECCPAGWMACIYDQNPLTYCGPVGVDLDCFDEEPPTFDPPDDDLARACGCDLNTNERKPSGCVTYENNGIGGIDDTVFEGVPNVEIYSVHPWAPIVIFNPVFIVQNVLQGDQPFEEDEFEIESTDENGCFKFDRKHPRNFFFKENYDFWLKFQNDDVKVRNEIWPWVYKTKVISQESGPLNDLQIEIPQEDDVAWRAAHVLDSDFEFREFCGQFGITEPSDKLNVVLGLMNEGGVASMLEKGNYVEAIGLYYCWDPGEPIDAILDQTIIDDWNVLVWGGWLGQPLLELIPLPDVVFSKNRNNSERIQELCYHEFTHASFYEEVGEPFWKRIRKHAVAYGGDGTAPHMGNANCTNADLVSLNEGWADYLGFVFRNEKHDRANYELIMEGLFLADGFVASGLAWDLIDVNSSLTTETAGVTDNVSGFTNSQIFNAAIESDSWLDVITELSAPSNEDALLQLLQDYGQ